MTCLIPHDNCPLFEEAEDHLACLNFHCCWTYVNPDQQNNKGASDDDGIPQQYLRWRLV